MAAFSAPRRLDPAGRAAWYHARDVLVALGEDPALSSGAIERYASAVSQAAALRREWRADGSRGVFMGPRGGVSPHPLVRMIERAERQAAELGDRLGLSPLARRKMSRQIEGGRPMGSASAPDRARPPRRLTRKVVPLHAPDVS